MDWATDIPSTIPYDPYQSLLSPYEAVPAIPIGPPKSLKVLKRVQKAPALRERETRYTMYAPAWHSESRDKLSV